MLERALERAKGKAERVGKGGQAEALRNGDEVPEAAAIAVPPEVAEAGVIFVVDGHLLRETASLSSVIYGMRGSGRSSATVPMFHLVTDRRQILIENEEELQA